MARRVRDAASSDLPALSAIAAAGGSPDADDGYFRFVAGSGRLLVACDGDEVLGFAGEVPVPGAVMVSDLFVAPSARGRGVGRLLVEAAVGGAERRMTFSSTHPAALHLYASLGMAPRWRLLTLRGSARGGGAPLVPGTWRHDRPELVAYLAAEPGAIVTDDAVVHLGPLTATVARLVSGEPEGRLLGLLAALPAGTEVQLSVPEPSRLTSVLAELGFAEVDHDVCCASTGVALPSEVCCVHRGLC